MNGQGPTSSPEARRVLFGLVLVLITIALQTLWSVQQDHQQTLAAETTNGLVASRLLEEHARQTLQDAAYTLDQVNRRVWQLRQGEPIRPDDMRLTVAEFDFSQSRHLKALQYVDPSGESWISSPDYPTHQLSTAGRLDVQFLLGHPAHKDVLLGQPYASPYDSQWVLPVSRNVFDADGRPIGVITVDVRVSYFGTLYNRVARENQAAVSLVSNDSRVIVRSPFEARFANRDLTGHPAIGQLRLDQTEGSFEAEGFIDDDPGTNLYTFRRSPAFPITAVYARSMDDVTAAWRERTEARVVLSFGTALLAVLLCHLLLKYMQRLSASQQSLRNSEQRFMTLFQSSPAPSILVRSADGTFSDVNLAWARMTGFAKDETIGKRPSQLNLWANADQKQMYFQHILRGEPVDNFRLDFHDRSGKIRNGLISSRPLEVGGEQVRLVTLIDVSDIRQAQDALTTLNKELEQRVAARTETLRQSNAELEQALATMQTMQAELVRSEKMAALGSLVAGVAHELNTPIGNSVTVASTLQFQLDNLANEMKSGNIRRASLQTYLDGARHGHDILLRSLDRAAHLVGSFKRVAVDQSSDLRRTFDLATALEEISTTLGPMYKKGPYTLELSCEAGIAMDSYPGALGQCITNFVSNALQHAFEHRDSGHMRLEAVRLTPDTVYIRFSDDGIGMDADTQKRVFDPFFTTKLGQGGSGLGMNIVYNLVHGVLGGQIHVTSTPGSGSCITMNLPCQAPVPNAATQENEPNSSAKTDSN